jgi:GTP cyclohydrolase I
MSNKLWTIEAKFTEFMDSLGLDMTDPSLKDTPHRVAKMFVEETCRWLFEDSPKITSFPNTGDDFYDGMVVVKQISVKSLCEHHFQPFIWFCHIAYLPKNKIIGLSKFARIVDYFARRPQVQERLTKQIYNFLSEILETEDIAVYIDSEHFCMKVRWVQEHNSRTSTAKLWWKFKHDQETREEFYHHISLSSSNL